MSEFCVNPIRASEKNTQTLKIYTTFIYRCTSCVFFFKIKANPTCVLDHTIYFKWPYTCFNSFAASLDMHAHPFEKLVEFLEDMSHRKPLIDFFYHSLPILSFIAFSTICVQNFMSCT